jgi:uncharacterized membrane protein
MPYFVSYLSALVTFVIVDAIWLGTMSSRLYKPILRDVLLPQFAIMPAVVFYLAYPVGLVIFAVNPALKAGSLQTAVMLGALFGLFTYGTYDLTNQATLRNWTTTLTLVDLIWGSVLGAITAASAFTITSKFAS